MTAIPTAPLDTKCYVCGRTSAHPSSGFRAFGFRADEKGRWVCADVQVCTERVFNPPPMWHEEFITDEALDRLVQRGSSTHRVLSAVKCARPELLGAAEIQVARDEMRGGWNIRARR